MINYETQYLNLVKEILEKGTHKEDRTGTGTVSLFGRTLRHKMSDGFPLLTTRKISLKNIFIELKWMLMGDTNIKYLVDNNCNIWVGDAYKKYLVEDATFLPNINKEKMIEYGHGLSYKEFIDKIKSDELFAKKYGELGPVYGHQWRNWSTYFDPSNNWKPNSYDQIQNLINELKTNPDSRRMMVNSWNVGELSQMCLPPCHYSFQVYTRELSVEERVELFIVQNNGSHPTDTELLDDYNIPERAISLIFNIRSNDVLLGQPYNISAYSLLLMMLAKQVNMVPDEVICNIGDVHIYKDQIPFVDEQLIREQYEFPTVTLSDKKVNDISEYEWEDIELENYKFSGVIRYPLSN